MKITKLGHCCMLIEENGVRILTDPGAWTTAQLDVRDIHVILFTHEHADHFHLDSLKIVLQHNPDARIYTNKSVGALLEKEGLSYQILDDGTKEVIKGVSLNAFGEKHAIVYPTVEPVENTGFLIGDRFFYPGDAFIIPQSTVEILALPIAGPWMKLSEAVDYAKQLSPRITFPVHDGMLQPVAWLHNSYAKFLGDFGLKFEIIADGVENNW